MCRKTVDNFLYVFRELRDEKVDKGKREVN